ncbi:MAG TPA: hypothetical protein VF786_00615 [Terriglobales bacterium]
MDIMNPKSPRDLSKAEHLRRTARDLKGKAERLIEEADALLAEANRIDNSESREKNSR